MLQEYLDGLEQTSFMYPSGVDRFKQQFAHLEEHYGNGERSTPLQRQYASLPRERICQVQDEETDLHNDLRMRSTAAVARTALLSPPRSQRIMEAETEKA